MNTSFSFVDTGAHNGAWNMAFDVQRAEALDAGLGTPLLRVYTWSPWCISLGRHQNSNEIDCTRTEAAGYDVVHRPTGGRAILHAEELTYSVVMHSEGRSIMDVYRMISEALVAGLRTLAPTISVARTQANFPKLYREPGGIPCFSSSARYEIEYEGRKLVGSAQRRIGSTVLQHGSILIGDAHLALPDYLAVSEQVREQLRHDMRRHTISLREILGGAISASEVAQAVHTGFERVWETDIPSLPGIEYISNVVSG